MSETMAIKTYHGLYTTDYTTDAVEFSKQLPDSSIQLIIIDPPYNLEIDSWDNFGNYMGWAKQWLDEIERILTEKSGSSNAKTYW